jgi:GMP synthase-like glutamine amidotransferase
VQKIKIGILKPGSAPAGLSASQGDYDNLFRTLLGNDVFDFVTYDVENGHFPAAATSADAWIITGSRHGVYEDHSWIAPLEALIRDIQMAARPLVGICFGHQIIAQALGGRVERAASGWIAGPQRYRTDTGEEFTANAWHRDQVVEMPAGAAIFATGDDCPFAGIRYAGPVLTLQAHPEFHPEYLLGLFKERGRALPEGLQDYVARETPQKRPDHAYLVGLLTEALRS